MVWKRPSGIPKGLDVAKNLEKMEYEDAQKIGGMAYSCLKNEWGSYLSCKTLVK